MGRISTGHSSNAMTMVTKADEGLYHMCAGPAKRGLAPMLPTANITIYNDTNNFWEVKLDESPPKAMKS